MSFSLIASNSKAFTVERDANKENANDCAEISDATSTAPIVYYE